MSESTTTDADVETRLTEFVDAIGESERYERFVASQQRLENDEEARQLLGEFRRKRRQLQKNGFDGETMAELRELQEEMDDDETINELREAEAALIDLLDETNDVVSERIGEEFARSTGGGCC
ncbi:halo-CC-star protein HcsL [Halalkalicoccus subterraneus]|uniref:halo-CC-star protein HcsL n=1 Tax=Halalkalicoccus subterraneus TaxID=2675002 RepID=UPI000EFAB814|nr:halo-CC-star protein HcsL [Halalkalicoccus subterraneus]